MAIVAADRAAEVLAETAERIAARGELVSDELARDRLADASEALADAIRPRWRRRALRSVLFLGIAVGVGVLVYRSPLGARLRQRLSPQAEPEPPSSITLPEPDGESFDVPAGAEPAPSSVPGPSDAQTASPAGNGAVVGADQPDRAPGLPPA